LRHLALLLALPQYLFYRDRLHVGYYLPALFGAKQVGSASTKQRSGRPESFS